MKYTKIENEKGIQSVRQDKQQQRPLLGVIRRGDP